MKKIMILASLLGFTACSEDPAPTRQRDTSSTKSDNVIEVADTELIDSMVEELNDCRSQGNLYEFPKFQVPGSCTETPLLDIGAVNLEYKHLLNWQIHRNRCFPL